MKFRFLILILLSLALLTGTVFAESEGTYLWDEANVLTSAEEEALNSELAEISAKLDVAIVVATVNNEATYSVKNLADSFFRSRTGYQDGVILYLAFGQIDNDYHIGAQGSMEEIFTEKMYDKIEDACLSHLSSGNYAEAISAYAGACEEEISSYGKLSVVGILLCIVVGVVLSFLVPMNILKGQLKTVRYQPEANSYIRKNSLHYTRKSDTFLRRSVARVRKPKNNSGSRGGTRGGRSGGGRSGKF